MKKAIAPLIAIPIIVFVFGLNWKQVSRTHQELADAIIFKEDFLSALGRASKVEIVEHSWYEGLGYFPVNPDTSESDAEIYEYKRLQLSEGETKQFLLNFQKMSHSPKDGYLPCAFEPHHSIKIHDSDGTKSVIKVCFSCGDTYWSGSQGRAPGSFQSVFLKFIEPLGFQAKRDWYLLAKEREEALETD